jgi:hypothetical protein
MPWWVVIIVAVLVFLVLALIWCLHRQSMKSRALKNASENLARQLSMDNQGVPIATRSASVSIPMATAVAIEMDDVKRSKQDTACAAPELELGEIKLTYSKADSAQLQASSSSSPPPSASVRSLYGEMTPESKVWGA